MSRALLDWQEILAKMSEMMHWDYTTTWHSAFGIVWHTKVSILCCVAQGAQAVFGKKSNPIFNTSPVNASWKCQYKVCPELVYSIVTLLIFHSHITEWFDLSFQLLIVTMFYFTWKTTNILVRLACSTNQICHPRYPWQATSIV